MRLIAEAGTGRPRFDSHPDSTFGAAMSRFGPFEAAPVLALAVSGGRDSMALAVLADRWARRRRGKVVALVVDHGLRRESRREAALARRRLATLGIASRLLVWRGDKPSTGLQEAARNVRYGLLEAWCARHGVLHLLTGHQQDDQAETVLMRLAHGSGPDGLAAIAAVVEREHVRVLRPLLDVPRAALAAYLGARGIGWIDDASNVNPVFARTRARAALQPPAEGGLGTAALAGAAQRMGAARATLERACNRFLARHAAVYPEGFARISRDALTAGEPEIARRALIRLLGAVAGSAYPPAGPRLDDLLAAIRGPGPFPGRTLAGCRIVAEKAGLLVVREGRAARARVLTRPAVPVDWDGRFRLTFLHGGMPATIGALGDDGWAELLRHDPSFRGCSIPAVARTALPALRDRRGLLCVPHLGYGRPSRKADSLRCNPVILRPARPLGPAEFPVV